MFSFFQFFVTSNTFKFSLLKILFNMHGSQCVFYNIHSIPKFDVVSHVLCSIKQEYFVRWPSQKKQKDSLEPWPILLVFLLELEISQLAIQGIYINSEKWLLSVKNVLVN